MSDEQFHNCLYNTPKHQLKYHTKCVPPADQDNKCTDYPCTNVSRVLVRLRIPLGSVSSSLACSTYLCPSPPPRARQSAAIGRGGCRLAFATICPNQPHYLYERNATYCNIRRLIGERNTTSFTDLNASKILNVVRTMLSLDIALCFTCAMRSSRSRPVPLPLLSCPVLFIVLLSVSTASPD